jgi:hypothetical protein
MQAAYFLVAVLLWSAPTMVLAGPMPAQTGSVERGVSDAGGATAGAPTPAGTAFTYQGQLKRHGVPVDGTIDGRFSLWAHLTSTDPADQVGDTVDMGAIAVTNGLFSIQLDFGSAAFNGDARWLEVEVRESGDPGGKYSTLVPREPITPSPYSLQTRGIYVDDSGKVGIGTQTPDAPLEVAAAGSDGVLISGGTEPKLAISDEDGPVARIGSRDGSLTFRPDGSLFGDPLVTMGANGKVGIGHAAPAAKVDVLGYWDGEHGPLTLRGGPTLRLINLGCANALGNCSWIMHMNGGNLEFSRKTAPTTWTPVLSLSPFGSIDIGLEVVQSGFLPSPAQAPCPAGKRVISGGCWCNGALGASQPNGNNWFCECRSGDTAYAYAFCARIQ